MATESNDVVSLEWLLTFANAPTRMLAHTYKKWKYAILTVVWVPGRDIKCGMNQYMVSFMYSTHLLIHWKIYSDFTHAFENIYDLSFINSTDLSSLKCKWKIVGMVPPTPHITSCFPCPPHSATIFATAFKITISWWALKLVSLASLAYRLALTSFPCIQRFTNEQPWPERSKSRNTAPWWRSARLGRADHANG